MKGERYFLLGTKEPAKWVPDPTGKYAGFTIPAVVEAVEVEVRWDTAHGQNVKVLTGAETGQRWYVHHTTPRWAKREDAERVAEARNRNGN